MSSVETKTETSTKLKLPSMYKVVLINDDFTPMEFVVSVLLDLFSKSQAEAMVLTNRIHSEGRGVAGVYIQSIAEQKVKDVAQAALHHGHPLKAQAVPE